MTTVEVLYRYATQPTEATMIALGETREVYGIRRFELDKDARTILVEYDATRLTPAAVANLLRKAGLSLTEELPLVPPQPETVSLPEPAPAK